MQGVLMSLFHSLTTPLSPSTQRYSLLFSFYHSIHVIPNIVYSSLRDPPSHLCASLTLDTAFHVHLGHAAMAIMEGVKKHAHDNAAWQPEVYTSACTDAQLKAADDWFKLDTHQ